MTAEFPEALKGEKEPRPAFIPAKVQARGHCDRSHSPDHHYHPTFVPSFHEKVKIIVAMTMLKKESGRVTLIDVRTPEEFRMGHAEGAINIPLDTIPYRMNEIAALPAPRILYCRSGNRSGMAVQILRQAGVTDVHNGGSLEDVLYQLAN